MTFLVKWHVSKTIQWLVKVFFIFLLLFTLFRVAIAIGYKPENVGWSELLPSFWLGLKYDLRWISVLLMPVALSSLFPRLTPFYSQRGKKFWTLYLGIITLLVMVFYGADFGQFAEGNARLNANAMVFVEDPRESIGVVWHRYPVIWILAGIAASVLMMTWMFRRIHIGVQGQNVHIHKFDFRRRWSLLAILVLGWFMYGFFTARPLNLFRAFNLQDEFKSNLALNPLQNFATSLRFRKPEGSTEVVKYYSRITRFLGMESAVNPQKPFARIGNINSRAIESRPNVVLVICESLAMFQTSMSGNPLHATPNLKQLAEDGIFFERCFSPSIGTGRSIFATLTGIPDVQLNNISLRTDAARQQRSILNDFSGYNKKYFIGGKSPFPQFHALVKSVPGMAVFEEGSYRSPRFNVWGISDKHLFEEATAVMGEGQQPFFSIIQLSGNHPPFSIPEEDEAGVPAAPSLETLRHAGFTTPEEYRSLFYMDQQIGRFMRLARQQSFFDNTLFVFIGDHGVEGNPESVYPEVWRFLETQHVPWIIYAPSLVRPQRIQQSVSLVDVLPTLAGMTHQTYTNTTLGRDVLNHNEMEPGAFLIYHAPGWIGWVNNDFFFRKNLRINKEELYPLRTNANGYTQSYRDSLQRELSNLTTGIYETAKFMLLNNRK